MFKMPHAGDDHGQVVFLAIIDGVLIPDGSSGLDESLDAFEMTHAYTVVKREKGITGQYSSLQVKVELFCLFQCMSKGIYPGGLPASLANQLPVFDQCDGIGF